MQTLKGEQARRLNRLHCVQGGLEVALDWWLTELAHDTVTRLTEFFRFQDFGL